MTYLRLAHKLHDVSLSLIKVSDGYYHLVQGGKGLELARAWRRFVRSYGGCLRSSVVAAMAFGRSTGLERALNAVGQ